MAAIAKRQGAGVPEVPEGMMPPGLPPLVGGGGRFAIALLLAALLEAGVVLWLAISPPEVAPEPAAKEVTKVHMVALPPPPVPAPPEPAPPPPVPPPPAPPPPVPVPPPPPAPVVQQPEPPKPVVTPKRPSKHTIAQKRRPPPPPPVTAVQPPTDTPPAEHTPPPPPAAPPVSAGQAATALQKYAGQLRARVQSSLVVPPVVRMMRLSGETLVAIKLSPSGALLDVSVLRSSGAPPIDKAALQTVRATQFAPFSSDMPQNAMTFTLRVHIDG
jgi:protein TonB